MNKSVMKNNNEKEVYTIHSGEGDCGSTRVVRCTARGLKRILTSERCHGDRWAQAYYGAGDIRWLQPWAELSRKDWIFSSKGERLR
jgi:hypothetical protein